MNKKTTIIILSAFLLSIGTYMIGVFDAEESISPFYSSSSVRGDDERPRPLLDQAGRKKLKKVLLSSKSEISNTSKIGFKLRKEFERIRLVSSKLKETDQEDEKRFLSEQLNSSFHVLKMLKEEAEAQRTKELDDGFVEGIDEILSVLEVLDKGGDVARIRHFDRLENIVPKENTGSYNSIESKPLIISDDIEEEFSSVFNPGDMLVNQAHAAEIMQCRATAFSDPDEKNFVSLGYMNLDSYLAPSIEMQEFTDGAKSVAEIFKFVKGRVKYEPYHGGVQSASRVFESKVGNSYDQSILLSSLLRDKGIATRFVVGDVLVHEEQLMKMWKLSNTSALSLMQFLMYPKLSSLRGQKRYLKIPESDSSTFSQSDTLYFRIPHVWIEAFIPYDSKRGLGLDTASKSWVPLDPSFENHYENNNGLTNHVIKSIANETGVKVFDRNKYLLENDPETNSTVKQELPSEIVSTNVESILKYSVENERRYAKTFPKYKDHDNIIDNDTEGLGVGPFGSEHCVFNKKPLLESSDFVRVNVMGPNISREIEAYKIGSRPLFIRYIGNTPTDNDNLLKLSNGESISTDIRHIQVKPELILGQNLIDTSSTSVSLEGQQTFKISVVGPSESGELREYSKAIDKGKVFAVSSHLKGFSFDSFKKEIQDFNGYLNAVDVNTLNYDEKTRLTAKILANGLNYLDLMEKESLGKVASALDGIFLRAFDIKTLRSGFKLQVVKDRVFGAVPEKPVLSWLGGSRFVPRRRSSSGSIDGETFSLNFDRVAQQLKMIEGSSLEHKLFETFFALPAQSTVSVIQRAVDNDINIVNKFITEDNIDSFFSSVPSSLKHFKDDVENGALPGYFTAPSSNVHIDGNEFNVALYQAEKPLGGGFALIGQDLGGLAGDAVDETPTGYDVNDLITELSFFESIISSIADFIDPILDAVADGFSDVFEEIEAVTNELFKGKECNVVSSVNCPVNITNGGMWHSFQDFPKLKGPGLNLEYFRVYRSLSNMSNVHGHGWTSNYNIHLETRKDEPLDFNKDQSVYFNFGLGQKVLLAFHDGNYLIPPASELKFEKVQGEYVVTTQNHLKYRLFGSGENIGKIRKLEDRNGNTLTFSYENGQLDKVTDVIGRYFEFSYNSEGQVIRITDMGGRFVEYFYDEKNDLVRSTDLNGQEMTYTYLDGMSNPELNHNMASFKDAEGRGVEYFYYHNDKVFKHIEPENKQTVYVYNTLNHETTVFDAKGRKTKYQYDILGNVKRVDFDDGTFVKNKWDARGNKIEVKDQDGFTKKFEVDERGNVVKEIFEPPYSPTSISMHDNFNIPVQAIDGRGIKTNFELDEQNGNILREVSFLDEEGSESIHRNLSYDSFGRIESVEDFNGNITSFDRSTLPDFSVLVEVQNPAGDTKTLKYDPFGRLVEEQSFAGVTTTFKYDNIGNLIEEEVVGLGLKKTFQYDGSYNLIKSTTYNGNETLVVENSYDDLGNLIRRTNSEGEVARFIYNDPSCNCSMESEVLAKVDGAGNKERFSYNHQSLPVKSIDPKGVTTNIQRDGRGNITEITVVDTNAVETSRIAFSYDIKNNKTLEERDVVVLPSNLEQDYYKRRSENFDTSEYHFTYDGAGNLVEKQLIANNRELDKIVYSYDGLNRLVEKRYDSPSFNDLFLYEYDNESNLIRLENNKSELKYVYDKLNRVKSVSTTFNPSDGKEQPAETLTYTYNEDDIVTGIKDGNNKQVLTYDLDEFSRPSAIKFKNKQFDYSLDPIGQVKALSYPNGLLTSFDHDKEGRLKEISTPELDHVSLQYQRNGNLNKIRSNYGEWDYSYDQNNQLIQNQYSGSLPIEVENFIWDASGNNKLGKSVNTNTIDTNFVSDLLRPLVRFNMYLEDGLETDSIYGSGKLAYRYDYRGNMIERYNNESSIHTFYQYDAENKLRAVQEVDASDNNRILKEHRFNYDGLGRRILKEVSHSSGERDTKLYVYDRDNILFEYNGSFDKVATYVTSGAVDDQLMAEIGNKTYYYHKDHLGSIDKITNNAGKIVQKNVYSAFGKIIHMQDGNGNKLSFDGELKPLDQPFYFTGREWDETLDLYYYRARYYDPSSGRFMSQDPLGLAGGDTNLYRYVGNNPLGYIDPYGLFKCAQEYNTNLDNVDPSIKGKTKEMDSAFQEVAGREATATYTTNGRHSENSLHYEGKAVDLRTRDLSDAQSREVTEKLKEKLGPEYDILFEKDHIHIEYDPK